jgi:hypothetical protein
VQTVLTAKPPQGYVATPNSLVSKEKLGQINTKIDQALKQSPKLTLNQATQLIEAEGLSDASFALTHLGYKIIWRGINIDQAEVHKS